jgi:hypothetical protein
MPSDVKTLHEQLRLSRLQCAYLHRELATALQQGPLPPNSFASEGEALRAENADLRKRLTLLTRHYEDLQGRYTVLERNLERTHADFDALRTSVWGGKPGAWQSVLADAPKDLAHVFTKLLTLAHPDKWSQGQPASVLAHELAIAINGIREQWEGRP